MTASSQKRPMLKRVRDWAPKPPSPLTPSAPAVTRVAYAEDEDLIPTKVGPRASEAVRVAMRSMDDDPMPSTQPARPATNVSNVSNVGSVESAANVSTVESAIVPAARMPSPRASEPADRQNMQNARAPAPGPALPELPVHLPMRMPFASFVRVMERELSLRTRIAIIAGAAALSSFVTLALTR